jgi:guanine deaminase
MSAEQNDRELMVRAVALALEAVKSGGGPFGALVAKSGQIIAEGKNEAEVLQDPTAHAEMQAIRAAAKNLGSRWLTGHALITSAEPCPMCLAACYWADIDRIVYAVSSERATALGLGDTTVYREVCMEQNSRSIQMLELPLVDDEVPFRIQHNNQSGLRTQKK